MTEWEYLTINELADLLQMNPQTIRNWISAGDLENVKVGRGRRIPRKVVVALTGGSGWEIPELMTVAQAAELLRLGPQTVYNWIDDGKLPAMHIGRLVRIKRAVVDEVLERGLDELLPREPPPPTATDFWLGTRSVGELVVAQQGSESS